MILSRRGSRMGPCGTPENIKMQSFPCVPRIKNYAMKAYGGVEV
jgi:hypothetical protein